MHTAALREMGLEHTYRALAVAPAGLADAVIGLRGENVLGANVTVPHKEAVIPLLDSVSDAVRAIGAVNTISNQGGHLLGDNTDVHGFQALLDAAGVTLAAASPARVVLLGAGGAARAALYVLGNRARTVLINRTPARAVALAADFRGHAQVSHVAAAPTAGLLAGADVIINTTSVGMEQAGRDPDVSPLAAELLPAGAVVIDMVYRPALPRLLRDALAAGLKVQGGMEMLVQQGAQSLRIWTGLEPPVATMRDAVTEALSAG